jgi:hypothetical protein
MRFVPGNVIVLAACCTSFVFAQSAVPQEFPPGAAALPANQLKGRLNDRVYGAKMADGRSYRFEWKSSGYFFLNVDNGFSDSGKWRIEDSRVCSEMQKLGTLCQEMRTVGDALYLKRATNGEVVALQPR